MKVKINQLEVAKAFISLGYSGAVQAAQLISQVKLEDKAKVSEVVLHIMILTPIFGVLSLIGYAITFTGIIELAKSWGMVFVGCFSFFMFLSLLLGVLLNSRISRIGVADRCKVILFGAFALDPKISDLLEYLSQNDSQD